MTYHFFYGGFLSQWYPCYFVHGNLSFNCAEQAMMASKAFMFDGGPGTKIFDDIMRSSDPHEQKTLGRCVPNFNSAMWNEKAREIVYWINYSKFQQNPLLREELYNTRPALLVEASPTDRLWGIGLGENDPKRFDPKQWRGVNWLGEVLTAVRDGKPEKWSDTNFHYDTPPPV